MTKLEKFKSYAIKKGYHIFNTNEGALMFSAPYEDENKIFTYCKRYSLPLHYSNVRYSWDYKEIIVYVGGAN